MNKRIIILIIILVLVVLGALWFFFFQQEGSISPQENGSERGFLGIFPRSGNEEESPVVNEEDQEIEDQETSINKPIPDFRQISFKPVAGYGVFSNGSTTIRFLEKETGHVFEASTDNLEIERLSNTTIPKIKDVLWSSDKDSVLMRYLDDNDEIQSFVTSLEKDDEEEFFSVESEPLSPGIVSINVFGDEYLGTIEQGDGSELALYNTVGNKESLATLPLSEWLIDYFSSSRAALQTKSSYAADGSLYYLNLGSVTLSEILTNISGLSSLPSPSGDFVLYSENDNGISTKILFVDDNSSVLVGIRTLADKCVWGSKEGFVFCAVPKILDSELPDSWYQGKVSFEDVFWRIRLVDGEVEQIFDPASEGFVVDAEKLQISSNNNFLFFVNRKDESLWSINLESL